MISSFLNFKIFLLIFLLLTTAVFPQSKEFTRYDSLRGTLSSLRSCYDVSYYDLNLKINISQKSISGYNTIYYKVLQNFSHLQIDLFKNLTIDSIIFKNKKLKYSRDSNAVFLQFDEEQKINSHHFFSVYYSGNPIEAKLPPWDGGFVWSKDSLGSPWVGVACEGVGASLWWPNKDHLSDEPDSMAINIEVPQELYCVANGNIRKNAKLENGNRLFKWFVSYPINNYNVTLNIADYAHYSDSYLNIDQKVLTLDYYVLKYNLQKAKMHFQKVKPMLSCFEKFFGPYPFYKDGYALVETAYLGMEHQSAIAYGNKYKSNLLDFDFIIVHETAHEWWGNSLSVKDHADLWVHESFATYAEALLVECAYNYPTSIAYLEFQKKNIENKEPIIGPYGVNYNKWEGTDMYYKGAWMLHTLRNVLANDSLWFQIIHDLANDFQLSPVSTGEITNYIGHKSGQDLNYFFDQYLKYSGIPVFQYSLKKKGRRIFLNYWWKTDVENFRMPVLVELEKGKSVKLFPKNSDQIYIFKSRNITDFKVRTDLFYVEGEKMMSD